jgi:HUS1 checkpoint protein
LDDVKLESLFNNEIWLEVVTDVVSRAFRSAGNSTEANIRLTKRDRDPMLALEMMSGRDGHRVPVLQEIPVVVLTKEKAIMYREPMVPDPDVHIIMPSIHHVKTIVDRMSKMGGGTQTVGVSANWKGEMVLQFENDYVEMETRFVNLTNPNTDMDGERNVGRFSGAHVDVKDFGRFLQSEVINPSSVVCCMYKVRETNLNRCH